MPIGGLIQKATDFLGLTQDAPQQDRMSAEAFGFNQGTLDRAQQNREQALSNAMGYQGGFMNRARDSFARQQAGLNEAQAMRGEGAGLMRGIGQFSQPMRNITQEGLDQGRGYMSQLVTLQEGNRT